MNLKVSILALVATMCFTKLAHADQIEEDIKTAHELYLSSDLKKTEDKHKILMSIKKGLEDAQNAKPENVIARDNLLGLYDQFLEEVYKAQFPQDILKSAKGQENLKSIFSNLKKYQKAHGDVIPTGWSLPEEFRTLVVSQERKLKSSGNKIEHTVTYFGWMNNGQDTPEQFQLIRYPNEVLIDKEKNIGTWSLGSLENAKTFWAGSEIGSGDAKDGLYLVNIRMAGQKQQTSGWVIFSRMKATEAPVVLSPKPLQSFKTATPTFKWENLTTGNYRPFESRKRMLTVGKINDDDSWKKVWSNSQIDPDNSTSKKLDKKDKLENGDYSFISSFHERWFFGDVLMDRNTATSVVFSVKAN